MELEQLVANLRAGGSDTSDVEVKAAAGGLPSTVDRSLSALANLPGGGTLILGLDERTGFRPVAINAQALKKGLANVARRCSPPVVVDISDGIVDGEHVLVAQVHECATSAKPCRTGTGKAYIRAHDGDYELSSIEEQAFLGQRDAPHFDRRPVPGTSKSDLDSDLVALWTQTVRRRSPGHGLARFDDDGMLLHAGVLDPSGQLTTAGLLTFGLYPQRWFPQHVVRAASQPRPSDPARVRARDVRVFDGPIPRMLDDVLDWAAQTFSTQIEGSADGRVYDMPEYPMEAIRELVANALVHRDLDTWSEGIAVELRHYPDRLVITNPGGLYGITVDRLGLEHVTSARNGVLVALCQNARTSERGARVIEALASGIPTVLTALESAQLPPPRFHDLGVRFTVILRSTTTSAPAQPTLTKAEQRIYNALLPSPAAIDQLEQQLGMHGPAIRKTLRTLRDKNLIIQHGGRGQPTTYEVAPER